MRDLLLDARTVIYLSVVSGWEIAIKRSLGIADAAGWCRNAAAHLQATVLPLRLEHIAALQALPALHKDPFDRMLIAQAIATELALVTGDDAIRQYKEVVTVWQ